MFRPLTPPLGERAALTFFGQDGGPVNGDIFKSHWCGFHDNTQIPRQSAPRYYQVARCRVEDSAIDAVSNQIMVCRLWANVYC